MSAYEIASRLNISERELFIRAHRAFGGNDRSKLEREIAAYMDRGSVPEYVEKFCRSYGEHNGQQLALQLVLPAAHYQGRSSPS